jgi:ethanolamine utilization protein EutA
MDIGGGTSNLAWIENGHITATGCMNVGGRLLKLDDRGAIAYISPVLEGIFSGTIGQIPAISQLESLADTLVSALEMAAGLRDATSLLAQLWTREAGAIWAVPTEPPVLSFSGGVADCIETEHPALAFGDLGPILGQSIRKSRLCQGEYRLGEETIRATVIGAGSHSTQLSGSTVFYRNIPFPMKNLPVVGSISALSALDGPGVLALPGVQGANYAQITAMADEIASDWPDQPIFIALQADMAKALGNALALRLPKQRPILCIDRVHLDENSYLDVGLPVDHAIPVVVKTLILNR